MVLGYKWSLDFVDPLILTIQHNQYVLVMIKYFSKWLELVSLSNCSNENVAYVFLDIVLNRFRVPIKVFTDQGI
jgi:hypothetical protein